MEEWKMGLFTSKIAIGVLTGGFTLAGAGLLFSGSETLQNASLFVKDAGSKIIQYESNETNLLTKFNALKTDASSKITTANTTIADKKAEIDNLTGQVNDLSTQKADLESQIASLGSQIDSLKADLAKSNGDLETTKTALVEKTAQYDQKVADLKKANHTIAELTKLLTYAKDKAVEADKHVTQLEGELKKANDEVAAHGQVVDQVKEETKDDAPMASGDVDALDPTVPAVDSE
jgi:chromosome segregation ATPase